MLKQKKLPKEVLEELKANPNISENMLEVARHTTIRDEGGERINGNNNDIITRCHRNRGDCWGFVEMRLRYVKETNQLYLLPLRQAGTATYFVGRAKSRWVPE